MDTAVSNFLRCPQTGGRLRPATTAELDVVNQRIRRGGLQTKGGAPIHEEFSECLVCETAGLWYPVRDGLPFLLADEAFEFSTVSESSLSTPMAKEEKLLRRRIVLDELDQNKSIDQEEYKERVKDYQLQMLNLQRALMETKHALIVVVEGPDAAGKGGAIKRLVEKLDPRTYRVYSIVKPTQEEHQHHYLWRFWTKLPAHGQIAIFDRSWYGRVLVERVEGFASSTEWRRAYREINDFERLLVDGGAAIAKFYLHISKAEQLDRFKRREADPLKHWKITEEDWRNRRKWDEHNEAAEEMFEQTSTPFAPWNVVEANFKWYARLKLLKETIRIVQALLDEP